MVSLGKLRHLLFEDKGVVLHWSHCELSNVYMLWQQTWSGYEATKPSPENY